MPSMVTSSIKMGELLPEAFMCTRSEIPPPLSFMLSGSPTVISISPVEVHLGLISL